MPPISLNPLFSLLRLVESLGGSQVFEICFEDGRHIAEIAVQAGRVCWITSPLQNVRLGDYIRQVDPQYKTPEYLTRFTECAKQAQESKQALGQVLLDQSVVPLETLKQALNLQLVKNANTVIEICGNDPLGCRQNPLMSQYDERLTLSHTELFLAVGAKADQLPSDLPKQLFEEFSENSNAAMLCIRSRFPDQFPLPIRSTGFEKFTLAQLVEFSKVLHRHLHFPGRNDTRNKVDFFSFTMPKLESTWVGIFGSHRLLLLRCDEQQTISEIFARYQKAVQDQNG